jgi:pyruvate formate lyase activating enzyme
MEIRGLNKTTLLDYPEHVAATIFVGGCNFRCPFCHNSGLLGPASGDASEVLSVEEVLSFLRKRRGILQGVCITGGEPTLQPDLEAFIRACRELGYLIKLDTNGYRPEVLESLLGKGLLDYVAMDIKASAGGYPLACGVLDVDLAKIKRSIDLLMTSPVCYEFRTTVVKGIHEIEEFEEIGRMIQGARAYYLQAYRENENVLCPGFAAFSAEEMQKMADIAKKYVDRVGIRGVE